MKTKDINDYNKCHKVAEEITHAIRGEEVDMGAIFETLEGNGYNETLFENLSSEDRFSQMHTLLEDAYRNKESEMLVKRLKVKEQKRIARKRLLIRVSASAAAVIVAVSFFLFEGKVNTMQKNMTAQIKVPTLMVNEKIIRLEDKKTGKIKAGDYVNTVSAVSTEEDIQRLIVPNGYTYQVVLADGTEAMLNAGSELIYPASFDGETRSVTLKGEAFFKVTKSDKPFIVKAGDAFVKVYGTSFNVNNRDTDKMTVILVEGSVGVGTGKGGNEVRIRPSQKAEVIINKNVCNVSDVEVNHYLGWINGLFMYNNANFEVLLKELALWYNVKFNYSEFEFSDVNINISLSRDSELDDVFLFIENVANVKFIKERSHEYSIVAQ